MSWLRRRWARGRNEPPAPSFAPASDRTGADVPRAPFVPVLTGPPNVDTATAAQLEAIRGVRNRETLRTLLKRKIIAPAGRARTRGQPVQYKTTRRFLIEFGLESLDELPSITELGQRAAFPLDLEPNEKAPSLPPVKGSMSRRI